jgi:hypothetical protein
VSASTERALDYIGQRARDVQSAFAPGAIPAFGDVASDSNGVVASFDPMHVALPQGAYLITRDANGRPLYTQDGCLSVRDGTVVAASGSPILGFAPKDGSSLGSISIDPVDRALGRMQRLRLETDGRVVYDRAVVDPRTGARELQSVTVGRVALARFPIASKLNAVDATQASAPAGVVPHIGAPDDGNFEPVAPMRRNLSHIDFDRSLQKLKDAYTAFDAVAAAHKAQGNLSKTTMDLLK